MAHGTLPEDFESRSRQAQKQQQLGEPNPVSQAIKHMREPTGEFGIPNTNEAESNKFIRFWAEHGTWPKDFAAAAMTSENSRQNKRARTSSVSERARYFRDRKHPSYSDSEEAPYGPLTFRDGKLPSYSQDRKDGKVPQQYTKAYRTYILDHGLDMDHIRGEQRVSPEASALVLSSCKSRPKQLSPLFFHRTGITRLSITARIEMRLLSIAI